MQYTHDECFRGAKRAYVLDEKDYMQSLMKQDQIFYESCPENENYFRTAKKCKIINTKMYAKLIKSTILFKEDAEYWSSPQKSEFAPINFSNLRRNSPMASNRKLNRSFELPSDCTLTPSKIFSNENYEKTNESSAPTPQLIRLKKEDHPNKTKSFEKSTVKKLLKYETSNDEKKDDTYQSKLDRFFYAKPRTSVLQASARRLEFE